MIERVIDARRKELGGVGIGRVLPVAQRRTVGPFIFLDHMGPADLAPGRGIDVPAHPHIGLSTVTYLFEGEIFHRDGLGYAQPIRPGEVNWMTAGRGIAHSERSAPDARTAGGPLHGVQAWVALPAEDEETDPAFAHHDAGALPTYEAGGVWGRLIAGSAFGATSPVRAFSPLFYLHWELRDGARTAPPAEHAERAIYVASGSVEIGGRAYGAGQMVVFDRGGRPVIEALEPSTVMALGGEPIGERFIWWNLVSSRKARIEEGKADWAAGRIPLPVGDDREVIPLPPEPKPPEPMS